MNSVLRALAISAAGLLVAAPAFSQESRCADCHFANTNLRTRPAPRSEHLEAWDHSAHGRNNVGCEKCHGGNATTFESLPAHVGILNSGNPASPVNRRNLPATCGTCHTGPLRAFQTSRHYELLQSANSDGPICSTCHGAVEGRLLSAKGLASRCNDCHGPGDVAPRAERAQLVREQYEALATVREEMKIAQALIKRVDNKERRGTLTEHYDQAQVAVTLAVDAGHKFVYDELRRLLAAAQQHVASLLSELANR